MGCSISLYPFHFITRNLKSSSSIGTYSSEAAAKNVVSLLSVSTATPPLSKIGVIIIQVVENYTHFRWVNFDTEIVYHLSCRADDWTVPQTLLGRACCNSCLEQSCGMSAGQSLQPPWSGSQTGSAILRTPGWWRQ